MQINPQAHCGGMRNLLLLMATQCRLHNVRLAFWLFVLLLSSLSAVCRLLSPVTSSR
jgi:hypothetical protein